jgi:hypothetical protein
MRLENVVKAYLKAIGPGIKIILKKAFKILK